MDFCNYFCAKKKDTGKWVYGDYVVLKDGERRIPCIYGKGEVIAETVRRYTGRVDRNGVRVYEKDVCRFYCQDGSASDHVILWVDKNCCYNAFNKQGNCCDDGFDDYFAERCEVIGNVIDNPQLMQGN